MEEDLLTALKVKQDVKSSLESQLEGMNLDVQITKETSEIEMM